MVHARAEKFVWFHFVLCRYFWQPPGRRFSKYSTSSCPIFPYPNQLKFGSLSCSGISKCFTVFDTWDRHRLQKFSRVLERLHWRHSTMPIFIAVYFNIASLNAAERFSDWTSLIDRKSTSKSWSIWKRPPRGFVNLYFLFSPLFYQQLQFDRAWARVSAQVTLFLSSSLISREPTGVQLEGKLQALVLSILR